MKKYILFYLLFNLHLAFAETEVQNNTVNASNPIPTAETAINSTTPFPTAPINSIDHPATVQASPINTNQTIENFTPSEKNIFVAEVEKLKAENTVLKEKKDSWWFSVGAFVFFLGIVFGLLLPKLLHTRPNPQQW